MRAYISRRRHRRCFFKFLSKKNQITITMNAHAKKQKRGKHQIRSCLCECHHWARVRGSRWILSMNETAENPFTGFCDSFSEANRKMLHGRRGVVCDVRCAMCCVFYIHFRKLKSPRNITSLMFALCRSIWCELKLGWSSSAFNQDFRSCGMVSPWQKRKFGAFLSLRRMNMTEIAPTNKTPLQLAGDNKDI